MPPTDLDVSGSASQRQRHKVGSCREIPLVHNCGKHAVQGPVPSGRQHCETPGPLADGGATRTSGPEMCVFARAGVPVRDCEGLATPSIIQAANERELVKWRARRGARTKYREIEMMLFIGT